MTVHGSGMAKAVVAAFKDAGFKQLTVFARNAATGKPLAELYGYQYTDSLTQTADIIVNVTRRLVWLAEKKRIRCLSPKR